MIDEDEAQKILRKIARVAEFAKPTIVPKVIQEDPDDDRILACALEGKVDLIVSGDRHLLQLKEYGGIPIIRPMDFLRTLGLS